MIISGLPELNLIYKKMKKKSVVTFLQNYRSSNINVKGLKTLVLVEDGERWKIFRENWKKF